MNGWSGKARIALAAAVAVMAFTAAQAPAFAQRLNPTAFAGAAMRPGAFVWRPEGGPESGPLSIVVSVPLQTAYVYRNNVLIGVTSVSTGKSGHETPTGVFTILQKDPFHHSNLYDDAPMPFMERLTWDGLALHGGRLPGYPASHGCVRLPMAFAELLYRETDLGATVEITDEVEEQGGLNQGGGGYEPAE